MPSGCCKGGQRRRQVDGGPVQCARLEGAPDPKAVSTCGQDGNGGRHGRGTCSAELSALWVPMQGSVRAKNQRSRQIARVLSFTRDSRDEHRAAAPRDQHRRASNGPIWFTLRGVATVKVSIGSGSYESDSNRKGPLPTVGAGDRHSVPVSGSGTGYVTGPVVSVMVFASANAART